MVGLGGTRTRFGTLRAATLVLVSVVLALAPSCGDDHPGGAPELQARTLSGGPWDLTAHKGRWVIVAFQASTCAPCKKEMPILSDLLRRRHDLDVVSVGLGETAEVFGSFLRPYHVTWPAIADRQARISERWNIAALPTTVIVGPDGKVAARFRGVVPTRKLTAALS
jgi:thiol-disulfide isomerase/thioredoxin